MLKTQHSKEKEEEGNKRRKEGRAGRKVEGRERTGSEKKEKNVTG